MNVMMELCGKRPSVIKSNTKVAKVLEKLILSAFSWDMWIHLSIKMSSKQIENGFIKGILK